SGTLPLNGSSGTVAMGEEKYRMWPGGRKDGVRIADLAAAIGAAGAGAWDPDALWMGGAPIDSRSLRRGALFFPLTGERPDGHRCRAQAFGRGAVAAVVEEGARHIWGGSAAGPLIEVPSSSEALVDLARWHRSRVGARVVAITGSMGKTTTKELVAAAL